MKRKLKEVYGLSVHAGGHRDELQKICDSFVIQNSLQESQWHTIASPFISRRAKCLFQNLKKTEPRRPLKRGGRLFAIFRHPVERAMSEFYYQKHATWERWYDPRKVNQTVEEYVQLDAPHKANWVTWTLAGEYMPEGPVQANLAYMEDIKAVLRQRFVVGLLSRTKESYARFEQVFGWTQVENRAEESAEANAPRNSFKHPTLPKTDPHWQELAALNAYDMEIYSFVVQLFEEQGRKLPYQISPAKPWHASQLSPAKLPHPPNRSAAAEGASDSNELATLIYKLRKVRDRLGGDWEMVDISDIPGGENPEQRWSAGSDTRVTHAKASLVEHRAWFQPHTAPVSTFDIPYFWVIRRAGGTRLRKLLLSIYGDLTLLRTKEDFDSKCTEKAVQEGRVRVIVSSYINDGMASCLFRNAGEGQQSKPLKRAARAFAIFRHPVDIAVAAYHYGQEKATHTLDEYIEKGAPETRNMVAQMLSGQKELPSGRVDEIGPFMDDIKALLRERFVVGLFDEMEASIARFENVFGWTLTEKQRSLKKFVLRARQAENHQALPESDARWKRIAELNAYDVEIYRFLVQLFEEQRLNQPYTLTVPSWNAGSKNGVLLR